MLYFTVRISLVTNKSLFAICSIYNEVVACVFRLGYMINSGRSVAVRTCQHMFPVQHSNALESKQKVWALLTNFSLLRVEYTTDC